jgi:3-oxoacyl-[acyl-carrier protein] reductase
MNPTKIAIVTGAGKGIGKAIALGLSQFNYKVVLIGRTKADLENVAKRIVAENGVTPVIFAFDISNSEFIRKTVKEIINEFGQIDVLVNNAGIYFGGSTDLSEEDFRKMMDVNLTAQFIFLQEIVPVMKRQESGYIFNVASRAGKIGFSQSGGYSASKFGLIGLNESLYRELVPLGIRVTALCPGWVNTKMAFEAGTTLQPEQMIQPEDLFLTLRWLLELSAGTCIKEVVLETPLSVR